MFLKGRICICFIRILFSILIFILLTYCIVNLEKIVCGLSFILRKLHIAIASESHPEHAIGLFAPFLILLVSELSDSDGADRPVWVRPMAVLLD